MSNNSSGTRESVGLCDIVAAAPALLRDTPSIVKGALAGRKAQPSAKTSIGQVFQERAARHADRVFLKFEGTEITYRQANEWANRYAEALLARGVGHGDVVGLMLRNSPNAILVMLGVVKCGAVAGMLNHNQRGGVLAHSMGLLHAKATIAESDLIAAIEGSGAPVQDLISIEDLEAQAAQASTSNPESVVGVRAKDSAIYVFTSGTTGMPKASIMTHYRWLRALSSFGGLGLRLTHRDTLYSCLPLYHNNALTVAMSSVLAGGATLALGRSFSASRFWDEVITTDATAFVYIGDICGYLLSQPPKPTDRSHRVRVIAGNGLRPAIWDEFTQRFGISRVCEFYAASEGNTVFLNLFNVDKTTGVCPTPVAFVRYDTDTGEPVRAPDGRLRKVRRGEPGLLLSEVSVTRPFDGYTDPAANEKKLVRNAFRQGDIWFNTGDVMRPQGLGHAAFTDRLGDTFRWKGENVATTEVEAAVSADKSIQACTAFGVEVPGTSGRAGMVAVQLCDGSQLDGRALARIVYDKLPGYALPLFVRVVDSLEYTSTFKSRKGELRSDSYRQCSDDPLYVLAGSEEGYVPFYPGYPDDVRIGSKPSV
ncbi:long-chain-acyl-CoA synthetase FadD6 [Mycobacterium sp. 134]|uniref:long-chain-acyl-CoA synthetase FadD6 n=1 Tax=Mycobacterium sp. 134 TaxID=3400425 RepID=UPI003AAD83EC